MAEAGALSLCTEQLPALLPLQHLIFRLFFPSVNHSLRRGALTSGGESRAGDLMVLGLLWATPKSRLLIFKP